MGKEIKTAWNQITTIWQMINEPVAKLQQLLC
jgi:hypothetical protein